MNTEAAPVLIACAHGTRDAAGRRAMAQVRLDVAARRPGLRVLAANVDADVQRPGLDEVVEREIGAGRAVVVVPLLLSAGYHMAVDVARAVDRGRELGGRIAAAPSLGPGGELAAAIDDRLDACGTAPGARILLVAAGSSDPRAADDVRAVADGLAERRGVPVRCGYLSAGTPTVQDELALLVGGDGPTAVATYLLAPGFFATRLVGLAAAAGVERVSDPLAPHDLVTDLVLRRYDETRDAATVLAGADR